MWISPEYLQLSFCHGLLSLRQSRGQIPFGIEANGDIPRPLRVRSHLAAAAQSLCEPAEVGQL